MMNFDWNLRDHDGFCIPKGPSFRSAKPVKCNILGSELSFRAPKHRPRSRLKNADMVVKPKSIRTQSDLRFRSNPPSDLRKNDNWEYMVLFERLWSFNGPWFSGPMGQVKMSILLFHRKEENKNISYFHPRAFEQTIADFLTVMYSGEKDYGRSRYISPIDWQPIDSLPVVATRLKVVEDPLVMPSNEAEEYIFFPISNQILVRIQLDVEQLVGGNQEERDKRVGRSSMEELKAGILSSIKLSLSPEAKSQQEKALEGLQDRSLVKDFPPLKWNSEQDLAIWEAEMASR